MRNKTIILTLFLLLMGCRKHYDLTDPQTTLPPAPLTTVVGSVCELTNIKQINGTIEFTRLSFQRDQNNKTIGALFFDSVTNSIDLKSNFQFKGDTIQVDSVSWMLKDHISSNIVQYHTRQKLNDGTWDNIIYAYYYDGSGRLLNKNAYYNQFIIPDYTTTYSYSGDNLISCVLLENSGYTKLLQTDLQYDLTIDIKPWVYLLGDGFENYRYVQGLAFGKKATNPIKQISTKIFDSNTGAVIESWQTSYSGYVLSSDKYVLQVSANGDNQQGMGLFIGTMRFDYSCK
jgi:hypothetical protein